MKAKQLKEFLKMAYWLVPDKYIRPVKMQGYDNIVFSKDSNMGLVAQSLTRMIAFKTNVDFLHTFWLNRRVLKNILSSAEEGVIFYPGEKTVGMSLPGICDITINNRFDEDMYGAMRMSSNAYPLFSSRLFSDLTDIGPEEIKKIKTASAFTSTDDLRVNLNNALIDGEDIVATDATALYVKRGAIKRKAGSEHQDIYISREVAKVLPLRDAWNISYICDQDFKRFYRYQSEDITIIERISDEEMTYPKWQSLIKDTKGWNTLVFDKKEILRVLKGMMIYPASLSLIRIETFGDKRVDLKGWIAGGEYYVGDKANDPIITARSLMMDDESRCEALVGAFSTQKLIGCIQAIEDAKITIAIQKGQERLDRGVTINDQVLLMPMHITHYENES